VHPAASQIFPIFSLKIEKKKIHPGITDPFPIERHPTTCNYYSWSISVEKSKTEWTKEVALPLTLETVSPSQGGGTLAGGSSFHCWSLG